EGADKDIKALTGKCNDREKYNAYFSEAVGAYRKAIDINPGNFDNYLNLGALYYNTAIEINKKMINLPLDADKEYAELESRRNELYKEALPYFEKALEIDPENIPTMQALKEIYAKTNNFEKMKEIKAKLGE
ncbi:MAG TPA: tetratricopeptide repeat protein, partial [Chitinophagales bacterium]|nr:tetratricopeptide repeat protein [Chitinophagales bacterium]